MGTYDSLRNVPRKAEWKSKENETRKEEKQKVPVDLFTAMVPGLPLPGRPRSSPVDQASDLSSKGEKAGALPTDSPPPLLDNCPRSVNSPKFWGFTVNSTVNTLPSEKS